MPIKNVFMIAGALLLIAGCSGSVTSPTSVRAGGTAANAKAPPTVPTSTTSGTATSADAGECRTGYFVNSGRTDSVCLDEEQ